MSHTAFVPPPCQHTCISPGSKRPLIGDESIHTLTYTTASLGLLLGAATGLYAPQPSQAAASSFLNQRAETMIAKVGWHL